MRRRYRVGGRIVHFEVDSGSESIIIELSRASLRSNPGLIIRESHARAIAAASGHSLSSSRAETGGPAGTGEAKATAAASRRYGFKVSE
jgi:hypothetical protein